MRKIWEGEEDISAPEMPDPYMVPMTKFADEKGGSGFAWVYERQKESLLDIVVGSVEGKTNVRLYITARDRAYWQRIVDIIEDDETAMDVIEDVIDIMGDVPDSVNVTLQTW